MKKAFIVLVLLIAGLMAGSAQAQEVYGNEWIDYSKTYYKIKVVNTGLHRLSYGFLDSLGLRGVNPKHLQLFRRGKEVSIYVAGENDGKLDPQDYVEFYGERNDGALDRELYKNPAHQVHQFYSLYTDTAAYFLTLAPTGGKRMREVNPSIAGRTPEPYHLQKAVYVNTDRFNYGKAYDSFARMPWLDEGEGYFSHYSVNPRTYAISGITNVETTGPAPRVRYATVGVGNENHKIDINVQVPSGGFRKLGTYQYGINGHAYDTQPVLFSDISPQGNLTLQVYPAATQKQQNSVSFAYGILTYPQKTVFAGTSMSFYTDSTRGSNPYFEFSSAPPSAVAFDVTDSFNVVRIAGQVTGSKKGFVIESQDNKTHKLLLADTAKPLKPAQQRQASLRFRKINPNDHNYILLTNKRLMKPAGGTNAPVPVEYAKYRASVAGGGYDTLLFTMEQVVNQFHYGEFSSNAIRRMLRFMATASHPTQLFIIGKGVEYASQDYYFTFYPGKFSYYQVGARHPKVHELDLVPTGIFPASDLFFSTDYRNSSYVPAIPVGRVTATTSEEVLYYLNKVKEYEAAKEGEAWRKNILQLSGGTSASLIRLFATWMKEYASIVRGPLLGANVIEKYRQNISEYVETLNVTEEVNRGVSLITFFGHGSPTTTDLNIGFASVSVNGYNNKGKYPIMLMNGCGGANAFLPNNVSFGDDWLLTPNKGAVAWIAHSDTGADYPLNLYSNNFYKVAFQDPEFYGKTLGEVQKETIRRVMRVNDPGWDTNWNIAMVLETVLQGDPALKLYSPGKPDYLFKGNGAVQGIGGEQMTAAIDTFTVTVDVENLGKAITDPLYVSVKRTLADNTVLLTDSVLIEPVIQGRQVKLGLSNEGVAAAGMNTFEVMLDSPNAVEELREDNNVLSFQHYFPVSGLAVVSPAKYSIVGTNRVKLAVQATTKTDKQGFYFELDTAATFNSPLRQMQTMTAAALPTWEVTLPGANSDSTVYYWRARFSHYEAEEDTLWASSSFRHIAGAKGGWSQSHYAQLQDVTLEGLENLKADKRTWEFNPTRMFIDIKTVGGDKRFTIPPYGLFIDGLQEVHVYCGNPAGSSTSRIFFVVVDNRSLEKVTSLSGPTFCSAIPYVYDTGDLNNPSNVAKIKSFLDAVPAGFYVAAVSINKVPFSNFSSDVKAAFRSIGSNLIDKLVTGAPFAIVGQKGTQPGAAHEATASSDDPTPVTSQEVVLTKTLLSNNVAGTITSVEIGPALRWETLHHNVERYKAGNDKYTLSLIGIDPSGRQQVLEPKVASKVMDLTGIDAKQYPNLKLSLFVSDSTDRTAPQLKEWFVLYEEVPEGVIRPDLVKADSEVLSELANRGSMKVPMAFQNVSGTAFRDSLAVEVTVSGDNLEPTTSRFKIKPVGANETVYFDYTVPTLALEGSYKLSLYVNPRLQPEQQYTNNIYEVNFSVKAKLHPIMEVTFDGRHLLDGDLVSPSPLISVTVKDENRHVFLQDPATMSIVLITPENEEKEISLMNNPQEVSYTAATEKNDFKLDYKPQQLSNGTYVMEVRAKDAVGKASGVSPYRISFEVDNESKVSNFYPFPNPFSTKTNFIFTLTGSVIPEHMKIQILTVTGKVVKEIMKEELGPIRIGNNKTAYAWDGTDMYGDKLANGVYLYRVIMRKGEEEMKHKLTFGDYAFKNGYGKIYILR
ncbi:putative type IX secretion system sortase PorU2 [Pontibacter ummariensis]|nr:C25 family cysteine peptidase [Pontibacter ummariensis]